MKFHAHMIRCNFPLVVLNPLYRQPKAINFSMISIRQMINNLGDEGSLITKVVKADNNRSGHGYQTSTKVIFRRNFFSPFSQIVQFSHLFSEKCWFCLSSPDVEKHLVITIGDSFYLALSKGPINQYHVLILSVTHIQSVALLSEEDFNELEKFKSALKEFFASK